QLEQLPQTQKAFATGDLGYQHVAGIAHAAEQVGAAEVRKAEAALVKTAGTMDPGQFTGFLKSYEHQVDAEQALTDANHAHQRRYLHISEPSHGLVRVDGLLDEEGGAILNRALDRLMPPPARDDDRTADQRRADALLELCQRKSGGSADGAGPRPHLVIRASVETLAGTRGAAAGELERGGSVPGETVRRLACDAALTRITGQGELNAEVSRAGRTIPPATRRALAARDHGCVAEGCGRPPDWTDAHHIKHWVHGGETTMANLVLLCRRHHRMVHEEGWSLRRADSGRWRLARPVTAHARSA
ncbi:MAG: HNH endonuclease, partial [Candidatus Dormibacteraeota bacterium]|nr:HNH endonuclease [Candidatus Dormibacteraeota bacterium]